SVQRASPSSSAALSLRPSLFIACCDREASEEGRASTAQPMRRPNSCWCVANSTATPPSTPAGRASSRESASLVSP
ncbi:hypothetical protein LTR16_009984, partial [Cryomyces antarcticus]